jgi:hypothetical protein
MIRESDVSLTQFVVSVHPIAKLSLVDLLNFQIITITSLPSLERLRI